MDFNRCSDCGSKLYIVSENIHGDKVLNCTRCNNVVREYSTTNYTQQRRSAGAKATLNPIVANVVGNKTQ